MRQGRVFVALIGPSPTDERGAPPTRPQTSWFRRETISLADIAVQILSVVVGILLALIINGWNTAREQRAAVDEAMHAIRAELAANRIVLRNHARQMFDMATRMRESPTNRNQPPRPCFEWDQWHGIGGLNLIDAAYQTSIATLAMAHMPFQQAQVVAQTYGWQSYNQKGVELDATMLLEHAQPLALCADWVEEIGQNDLRLDAHYAGLIGPDTAVSPMPATQH